MGQTDKREIHRPDFFFVEKGRQQLIKKGRLRDYSAKTRLSHACSLCASLCSLEVTRMLTVPLNMSKVSEESNFILNFNYNSLQVPTS